MISLSKRVSEVELLPKIDTAQANLKKLATKERQILVLEIGKLEAKAKINFSVSNKEELKIQEVLALLVIEKWNNERNIKLIKI